MPQRHTSVVPHHKRCSIKKIHLLVLYLGGFSALSAARAQEDLSLINPATGTSTVTVAAGGTFSLNVEVEGPTNTPPIDAFDITLTDNPTATSPPPLPAGITLTGFSNLTANFTGGSDAPNAPLSFTANANDPSDDIISSPTTEVSLVTANFSLSSALAPGTYDIDFASSSYPLQDLVESDGTTDIPYTPYNAIIDVQPALPDVQSSVYGNTADLTLPSSYQKGVLPTMSSDLVFTNPFNTALTTFTVGPNSTGLSVATLDDLTPGTLTINNSGSNADTLTLNGGKNSGAPSAGDILYVAPSANLTIGNGASGTLGLSLATTGNFDVSGLAVISSIISGQGGITETGSGTTLLTGTNTFTGQVTLTSGTLAVASVGNSGTASALGAGTNPIAFNGGELLYAGTGAGSTNDNFTITSGDTAYIGVNTPYTTAPTTTATTTGAPTGEGSSSIEGQTTLTLTGAAASSTGGLTKLGGGTLILEGANLYSGTTTAEEGTLELEFATGSLTTNILYNGSNTGALVLGAATGSPGGFPSQAGVDNSNSGFTFNVTANNGTANSQTFGTTAINPGNVTISTTDTSGTVLLNLGSVTDNAGGMANFKPAGTATTNGIEVSNSNDATGILGGWAIYNNSSYATVGTGGILSAYSSYTTVAANGVIADSGGAAAETNIELSGGGGSTDTYTLSGTTNGATNVNTITNMSSGSLNGTTTGPSIVSIGTGNTLRMGVDGGVLNDTDTLQFDSATSSAGILTAGGNNYGTAGVLNFTSLANNDSVAVYSVIANDNASTGVANSTGGGAVTVVWDGANNNGDTLTLYNSNTYSGGTYIDGGRITVQNAAALGTGAVYVQSGGTLNLVSGTLANTVYINGAGGGSYGAGSVYFGAINLDGGTVGASGSIVLQSDSGFNVQSSGANVSAAISGAYNLNLQTSSRASASTNMTLSGNNTNFTGNLSINGYVPGAPIAAVSSLTVELGSSTALGYAKNNIILNGAVYGVADTNSVLDLHGYSATVDALEAYGTGGTDTAVTNNSGTPVTFTIGNGNGSGEFAGEITQGAATSSASTFVSGDTLNLVKEGTGTENLTGSSNYNGTTAVTGGDLQVNGSISATSSVAVGDTSGANGFSGTLSGTGTITSASGITVYNGSTLAPGLSTAGLTVGGTGASGALKLNAGATLQLSLTNSLAGTGAPALTDYSKLTLTSGTLATLAGAVSTSVGTVATGDLFTFILSSNTPVSGMFSNADTTMVSTGVYSFTSGGEQWLVNYNYNAANGTTADAISAATFEADIGGDDVALLAMGAVPEPSEWFLLGLSMVALVAVAALRRRRVDNV
jgi:fibronectin-binding autotransporter adhesin